MIFSGSIYLPSNFISLFFTAAWYSIVYVLLVADRHSRCFHFLFIVKRAQWTLPSKYLWNRMSNPLGICQWVVLLGHTVDLFLAVFRVSILIHREVEQFAIPQEVIKASPKPGQNLMSVVLVNLPTLNEIRPMSFTLHLTLTLNKSKNSILNLKC